jgi:hypothetical protein
LEKSSQIARGAYPVRGKGRAHPLNQIQGYEASFSLIPADSRHALKRDSYIRSDALSLPPHPNLEQYKKLARDFQRACKSADAGTIRACRRRSAVSIQYRSNPASYIPKLLVQELQQRSGG